MNTGVATDQPKTQSGFTWVYGKTDYPQWLISRGKFFTYVTKTRPNSTTYSRKPGNYNGTIIFEIDIMKKSYPIN